MHHVCFYVNVLVIAENHICLLVCMLLLSIREVVCTLVVFVICMLFFFYWFSHFLMDLDILNVYFFSQFLFCFIGDLACLGISHSFCMTSVCTFFRFFLYTSIDI